MLGARLVLLVCALTVFATQAEGQSQCTTVNKGSKEKPNRLADALLAPGQSTWTLSIPLVCRRHVGIQVTVCDEDVPPAVTIVSLQMVEVVRRGVIAGPARLSTVVYCASGYQWPALQAPAAN